MKNYLAVAGAILTLLFGHVTQARANTSVQLNPGSCAITGDLGSIKSSLEQNPINQSYSCRCVGQLWSCVFTDAQGGNMTAPDALQRTAQSTTDSNGCKIGKEIFSAGKCVANSGGETCTGTGKVATAFCTCPSDPKKQVKQGESPDAACLANICPKADDKNGGKNNTGKECTCAAPKQDTKVPDKGELSLCGPQNKDDQANAALSNDTALSGQSPTSPSPSADTGTSSPSPATAAPAAPAPTPAASSGSGSSSDMMSMMMPMMMMQMMMQPMMSQMQNMFKGNSNNSNNGNGSCSGSGSGLSGLGSLGSLLGLGSGSGSCTGNGNGSGNGSGSGSGSGNGSGTANNGNSSGNNDDEEEDNTLVSEIQELIAALGSLLQSAPPASDASSNGNGTQQASTLQQELEDLREQQAAALAASAGQGDSSPATAASPAYNDPTQDTRAGRKDRRLSCGFIAGGGAPTVAGCRSGAQVGGE